MARRLLLVSLLVLRGSSLAAQTSGFVLLADTAAPPVAAVRAEPTTVFHGRALEPSAGATATAGRFTLLASRDLDAGPWRQSTGRHAEWLARLTSPRARIQLAAGSGLRREYTGEDVLIGRATLALATARSRVVGNVTLERPLGGGRDALDVITAIGWTRTLSHSVALGAEALGEDLEGLWDPREADGGARLFIGPSMQWHRAHGPGLLRVTAGADLRGTSAIVSGGPRSGFAVRATLSTRF